MCLGSLLASNEFIHLLKFHRTVGWFGLEGFSSQPLMSSTFPAVGDFSQGPSLSSLTENSCPTNVSASSLPHCGRAVNVLLFVDRNRIE